MDHKVTDTESQQRDWYAEIAARVPGFPGYPAKEQRHVADKSIRDTIATKLDDLRDILADVIEQAGDAETSTVDDLTKILRTMNELRDRAEFLGYGDSAFFLSSVIGQETLQQMYQLETEIYDNLDRLETLFESSKDLRRRDVLRSIRTSLEDISQDFNARREIMKSVR